MAEQLREYLIRVRDLENHVVGAAFLAAPRTVITCAHVVARAFGQPDEIDHAPEGKVRLDFPRLRGAPTIEARVVSWQPVGSEPGDIAVLELIDDLPDGTAPARLMRGVQVWRHPFNVLGFPEGYDDGVIATGTLLGALGAGWVQMDQHHDTAYRVEAGFSGAPVFDEVLNGVVGMTVAADASPDIRSAFMLPAETLFEIWPALADRSILASPYRSLRPFDESDVSVFFGREAFVRDRLLPATQQNALVAVVVGSSGSGKTSVVLAGLLPALHKDPNWTSGMFRPDERPFHSIAATLSRWLSPELGEVDALAESVNLGDRFARGELHIRDVVDRLDEKRGGSAKRYVLVADEFEKLFTLCSDALLRDRFLAELAEVVTHERARQSPTTTIVITMRADFLQQALDHALFAEVLQDSTHFLGAMTHDELTDAIVKPAEALGVTFAEGLVERIIEDLGPEPGRLPLLQFALALLWAEQNGEQLTHGAYEAIGQVEGALAEHAEAVFNRLGDEDQERARRLMVQLVEPGSAVLTRRVARKGELGDAEWSLAQQFSFDRLVIIGRDEGTGAETVDLIHEALIVHWQRLRDWIYADREFREWQERIRARADHWLESGRDQDELLQGAALADAEERMATRPSDLGADERKMIEASVVKRDAVIKRQLRDARRKQWAAIGFGVIALVALGSFYAAVTNAYDFDPVAYILGSRQVLDQNPMVALAGGETLVGVGSEDSTGEPGEIPAQTVNVAPFAIQKYEVSNAQFRQCHLAGACSEPLVQTYWADRANDTLPIVEADAFQAADFCAWLNARLPDTFEWEHAARGTDGRPWPWGSEPPTDTRANLGIDAELVSVDRLADGATIGSQIFNLVGNASEWTRSTVFDGGLPPVGEWDGRARDVELIVRGASAGALMSRITESTPALPTHLEQVGFRCARSTA